MQFTLICRSLIEDLYFASQERHSEHWRHFKARNIRLSSRNSNLAVEDFYLLTTRTRHASDYRPKGFEVPLKPRAVHATQNQTDLQADLQALPIILRATLLSLKPK